MGERELASVRFFFGPAKKKLINNLEIIITFNRGEVTKNFKHTLNSIPAVEVVGRNIFGGEKFCRQLDDLLDGFAGKNFIRTIRGELSNLSR